MHPVRGCGSRETRQILKPQEADILIYNFLGGLGGWGSGTGNEAQNQMSEVYPLVKEFSCPNGIMRKWNASK